MMNTNDFNDHTSNKGEQRSASEALDNLTLTPGCHHTVDQLQCVLDGELPLASLDANSHPSSCPACRERIAAAKILLSMVTMPIDSSSIPAGLTDKIVASVLLDHRAERRAQIRRGALTGAGALVVAAGLFLAVWLRWFGNSDQNNLVKNLEPPTTQPTNSVAEPPSLPPTQRTVRLADEFSKAEQAFLDSSRPITEPAAIAPQMLVKLTDVLMRPSEPSPEFEPARISLMELPEAARNGLQPVTTTAQKAFVRLMRDVGAVQSTTKPN